MIPPFKVLLLILVVIAATYVVNAQQLEAARGDIKGVVVDDRGQPFTSVGVTVRRLDDLNTSSTITTNREGQFEFRDLDSALYYLIVNVPAYVPMPRDPNTPAPVYRIGDFARIVRIRGGVITGIVTNSAGEPLVSLRVRALMVRDGNGQLLKGSLPALGQAATDDRGVYRIYGLLPGTYILEAGGYVTNRSMAITPYDTDAPTYGPSSTRDNATEVTVSSAQEVTMDIRYLGERGYSVSGMVTSVGPGGANIHLAPAPAGSLPPATSYQAPSDRGFAMHGVPDGDYDLYATQSLPSPGEIALSDIRRIKIRGADVTGMSLTTRPLASVEGQIELQPSTATECKGKRRPLLTETAVSLQRSQETSESDARSFIRPLIVTAVPDSTGKLIWQNLFSGKYAFTPRFHARYWYLESMTIRRGATSSRNAAVSTQKTDAARQWTNIKDGERLRGLVITLAEGAASVRGRLNPVDDATLPAKLSVFLVPAEREKSDDVLRYFVVEVGEDRTFDFDNLPPGRYWALAQPDIEVQKQVGELRSPDAGEDRLKLRRAAELTKNEIELKPCQNLADYQLSIK